MEHLEFVNKLDTHGINIRTTVVENREKEFVLNNTFGESRKVIAKNHKAMYKESVGSDALLDKDPLNDLIRKAVDSGQWKHSLHNEIKAENYEKFIDIIQHKIINKSSEIDELLTIMFLIRKKIKKCKL